MLKKVDRWTRSSLEVFFIVCPACCERVEVELDPQGDAFAKLRIRFIQHLTHHYKYVTLSAEFFKRAVHCDRIDLTQPLDISDIISQQALTERAYKLSRSRRIPLREARERVERRIRVLLNKENDYRCLTCGLSITPAQAQKRGYGICTVSSPNAPQLARAKATLNREREFLSLR